MLPARNGTALSSLCLLLLAMVTWGQPVRAHAAPLAVVTEIAGKAETRSGEQTVALALLSELASGARVKLYPNARMMLMFYGTGELYALMGPSLVRITAAGVEALSGNEPTKQTLSGRNGKPLVLRPSGVTQAGIVVRSVAKPITPLSVAGGVTLDAHPVFRWREPEPGLEYRFVLRDGGEAIVLQRNLRDAVLATPPDLTLEAGQRYRWSVTTRSPSGTDYALGQSFFVADAQTRADVANFQPAAEAGTAQRVAYAIWLEQAGLEDEARACWLKLAAEGVALPPHKRPQ